MKTTMALKQYKKDYDGDYIKSYRDNAIWKKQNEKKRIQYESISKKVDSQTYNKKEKANSLGTLNAPTQKHDPIFAEGSQYKDITNTNRRQVEKDKAIPDSQNKTTTTKSYTDSNNKKTIVVDQKRWQNAYEQQQVVNDDGNYNNYNPPIQQIGINRYRNLKTNKEIGNDDARKVLEIAGYTPKKAFSFQTLFIAFIVINILFKVIAPIIAIGYGIMRLSSDRTTWIKITGNQIYKTALPANDEETNSNRAMGIICIFFGLIAAFIHYKDFLQEFF